jgi:hypothetical protein
MKTLALDLGKSKSAVCVLGTAEMKECRKAKSRASAKWSTKRC